MPIGFLTDDGPTPAAQTRASAPVATIARRVQALRGLRFERLPKPVRITRRRRPPGGPRGPRSLVRAAAPPRRRGAATRCSACSRREPICASSTASIFGEQVAGYYDPRSKDLRIVEGAGHVEPRAGRDGHRARAHARARRPGDRARPAPGRGLRRRGSSPTSALVEGVATEVMYDYLTRHFDEETALGGLLGGAFAADGRPAAVRRRRAHVPVRVRPAVRRDPAAPRRAALDARRPRGAPAPARLDRAGAAPGEVDRGGGAGPCAPAGARRRAGGRATSAWPRGSSASGRRAQLLALAGRPQAQAAAGWGGDRYELWRRTPPRRAGTPCTGRDVLVMRWTWDTRARRVGVRGGAARHARGRARGARRRTPTAGRCAAAPSRCGRAARASRWRSRRTPRTARQVAD